MLLENFIGQGLGVPMGEGDAKWGRGSAWGSIYLFIKLRKKIENGSVMTTIKKRSCGEPDW